jgi:hypothetical protein
MGGAGAAGAGRRLKTHVQENWAALEGMQKFRMYLAQGEQTRSSGNGGRGSSGEFTTSRDHRCPTQKHREAWRLRPPNANAAACNCKLWLILFLFAAAAAAASSSRRRGDGLAALLQTVCAQQYY